MASYIKLLDPALLLALGLAALVFGIDAMLLRSNARLDILYVLLVILFRSSPHSARGQQIVLELAAGILVVLPLAMLQIEVIRQPDQWLYRGAVVATLAYLMWIPAFPPPTVRPSASDEQKAPRPIRHAVQPPTPGVPEVVRIPPAKREIRPIENPKSGRERRVYPRFEVFATVQVAPYSGTARLSYSRFREFSCRDLSQNGMAFLASEVLTWNVIVVSLRNQDERIYRVAEIVRCRTHYEDDGSPTYLYGCRFTGRPCPKVVDAPDNEFMPSAVGSSGGCDVSALDA